MLKQLKKLLPLEWNYQIKHFYEAFPGKKLSLHTPSGIPRLFFLDAASYNNLGDQAIAEAMSMFLQEACPSKEYIERSEADFLRYFRSLQDTVRPQDILCLSGGGNMGNWYPKYEAIRRKVIIGFPDNRIIIFPQTLDYETDSYGQREMARSAKVYNRHSQLTVCAREEKSFKAMSAIYNQVILVPDIVFYLNKYFHEIQKERRYSVGICLRSDDESAISADIRWEFSKQMERQFPKVRTLSTMDERHQIINKDSRRLLLENKLKQFSDCQVVITDRLHGMIFCILTGTPCVAIDNRNGKVSGAIRTVTPVQNICVVQEPTLNNLIAAVKEMSSKEPSKCTISPQFYTPLIEKLL